MARTMLNESKLNDKFWGHAVHTTTHILNIGLLKWKNDKNPDELWTGKEINVWLESDGKKDKVQTSFRRHHSIIGHLIILRIIAEECCDSKFNIFCFFVDFIKVHDIVPINNP